jgi:hypothetical protein
VRGEHIADWAQNAQAHESAVLQKYAAKKEGCSLSSPGAKAGGDMQERGRRRFFAGILSSPSNAQPDAQEAPGSVMQLSKARRQLTRLSRSAAAAAPCRVNGARAGSSTRNDSHGAWWMCSVRVSLF